MENYKKYSLGQLSNFVYDAMGAADATPQEIYDTIKYVVEDNYYTYKHQTSKAYELLALLNGNGNGHVTCYKDDQSPECQGDCDSEEVSDDCMPPWGHSDMEALQYTETELNAMCDAAEAKDKVVKWIIPVDDDYNITFPEDLLEKTGWKEGDTLQWIPQDDDSFIMKKVIKE
ncbi:MAG: AbrB/MazE/SpoVT family DNA-binding domain-containing protein [Alphaproteobacteria bacterium]|nr:AbrB/MazE/SpoVT family DNA-binding domain-containing protein [Alphaproteobacteria bacterium]